MVPPVGRLAFTRGLSVFLLALITLPFLDPSSAEFVANLQRLFRSPSAKGGAVTSAPLGSGIVTVTLNPALDRTLTVPRVDNTG